MRTRTHTHTHTQTHARTHTHTHTHTHTRAANTRVAWHACCKRGGTRAPSHRDLLSHCSQLHCCHSCSLRVRAHPRISPRGLRRFGTCANLFCANPFDMLHGARRACPRNHIIIWVWLSAQMPSQSAFRSAFPHTTPIVAPLASRGCVVLALMTLNKRWM